MDGYGLAHSLLKTRNGDDPVSEFILRLPLKDRAKVLWTIQLLAAEGIRIRKPHAKTIEKNLFELRVIQGSNIQRVFYYLFDGTTFVLLQDLPRKRRKSLQKKLISPEIAELTIWHSRRNSRMPRKPDDLDKLEVRLMEDPAFVAEYKATKLLADLTLQIIRARYDAGLTQKQLADKIGTRQSVISRIESFDYGGMSLRTLQRIARALDLEVDIQLKKTVG